MKNVKILLDQYFYISPLDSADFAEKNRIRNYYMCWLALAGSSVTLLGYVILHHNCLRRELAAVIFFGICVLINVISIILSRIFKNTGREKAYFFKNIPLYTVFSWGMISSVYNYYIQKESFIGVVTFFNAVLVTLCVFYISLPVFSIFVLSALCGIAPGIYSDYGLTGFLYFSFITFLIIVLAFFSRYKDKQIITALKRQKKSLVIKTFGNFTPLYDKKVIRFQRTKSSELLAYLIYKDGSSVNTKELISVLYGDYADSARYGASLRNLISDIKHSLSALEIQNFFITEYNNFRINPEVVKCDYYDFLAGDKQAVKAFAGEFMSQYSWAEGTAAYLSQKACGNKV